MNAAAVLTRQWIEVGPVTYYRKVYDDGRIDLYERSGDAGGYQRRPISPDDWDELAAKHEVQS